MDRSLQVVVHDVVFGGVKVELVHSLLFRVVKMALELGLSVGCSGAYLRSTDRMQLTK